MFSFLLSLPRGMLRRMADHIPLDYEPRRPRQRFFTPTMLAGLVILLVALGVVGVGVWTQMVRWQASGNRSWCYRNLRDIGFAVQMYAGDHHGVFPDSLETAFLAEGLSTEVFICPNSSETKASDAAPDAAGATPEQIAAKIHAGGHCSFVYVGANLSTSVVAGSILAFEFPSNHGMDGGYVLYADRHTEFLTLDKLVQLVPALEAGQNPPVFAALTESQAKTLYAQRWLPQLSAMQSGQWEKKVTNQPTTRPAPAIDAAVP